MKMKRWLGIMVIGIFMSCFTVLVNAQEYVLLGWNDLGMHCANKDFSKMAVLPPYNNIYAQLIKKSQGQLPQIVTNGYEITYSIPNNTYSVGKTNFWTYAQQLFGLKQPLPDNIGLTGKGLTGNLDAQGNYFFARGIPVTPYEDNNLTKESPFQLIHLVARQTGSTNILAATDVVIPVSNELSCLQSGCHSSEQGILDSHGAVAADFNPAGPNLCASCHADNALGTTGDADTPALSLAVHEKHSRLGLPSTIETCYKCHPGPNTRCLRDAMSQNSQNPLICQSCHGNLSEVSSSIKTGGRRPWLDEPRCGNCHGSSHSEETGKLFRESKGHSGIFCSACHGSPHAIVKSREANDNLQNLTIQGYAGTLNKCTVCHGSAPSGTGPHGLAFTGIDKSWNSHPDLFCLMQNYPNPFNPVTKIRFNLPKESRVTLKIYNILGDEVATLINGIMPAGAQEVSFEAKDLSSGFYTCVIKSDDHVEVKKMLYLK